MHDLWNDPVSGGASATIPVGDLNLLGLSDGYIMVEPTMVGSADEPTGAHDQLAVTYQPVRMPIGCFLLRGERNVLIDTGYGPVDDPVGRKVVGGRLLGELARVGLTPADIDVIALSHLHGDHSGTVGHHLTGEPIFPNARVYLGAADWQYFVVERKSLIPVREYIFSALSVLEQRGQVELLDDDRDIVPGLRRIAAPGHTPGHSLFLVHDAGERVLLLGDAMYCPQQLTNLDWSVAFDADPALARRTRERLARDLEHHGGGALGCHFPELKLARALTG